jgi:hypothetical protein
MDRDIFKDDNYLLRTVDSFFSDQLDTFRLMNEQIIWRNLLYYEGEQYIEFLRSTRSFRRRPIPDFVPTPVSNDIREYVRSVKAMLMNQKTVPRVWPNSNDKEDIQAADVGEALLLSLNNENDGEFYDEQEKLCIWIPIAGTVFMRTYPDADGGLWMPNGGKTASVGRECILPFSTRLDTMGDKLNRKRWVGIESLKDREWVEDIFKTKVPKSGDQKPYVDYQKSLAQLIGSVSPWKGQSIANQSFNTNDESLVIFREVEFAPTQKYPLGKYVSTCGGKVIQRIDRLPLLLGGGEWNYTLTDFHFNYVPGRFWSSGGVNDLISPQNTINQIDQSLAINRMGMGKPKIFTPGDVGVKQIGTGGHGFIQVTFNPIMGQKPSFEQGTPLPQQVLEERSLQKQQFQEGSGDPKNVLRGQAPSANASGILTDVLRETAESGKAPDIDRFNRSMARVFKKTLIVAQEVMTEERILKITGRGNKIKIMKFKAADLRSNNDVRLEPDSGLITTKSGQSQMLLNMIQAGFFKEDGGVSPTVRQEVLTRMGMTSFEKETNNDVERAESENVAMASGETSVFTATVDPKTGKENIVTDDPIFDLDDHKIHHESHRKYIIGPEFKELEQSRQVNFVIHDQCHQRRIQEMAPDIREYVQVDKLLAANVLTPGERTQVLGMIGIQADDVVELGIPTADTATKAKQKTIDTQTKETTKQDQMDVELIKHTMDSGVKIRALQTKKVGAGGSSSKP